MDPNLPPRRRRIARRTVLGGAGLGAAGLALVACTPSAPPPAPATTAAPTTLASPSGAAAAASPAPAARQPKYGGTLRISVGAAEMPHLDPHQTNSAAVFAFGHGVVWSQLLTYKNGPDQRMPTYEVVGDLAESWTQPDDLTYVFKIRPGVKYQNLPPVGGREADAEDVVQSFRRQMDLKVNSGFLQGIQRIDAPDRNTARITLDKPSADFLASIAATYCKVLPRETFAQGDLKEGPVIGSGPWTMGNWERDKTLELLRNPDYYQKGRPYLEKVQWFRLADAPLQAGFRANSLDVMRFGYTKKEAEGFKKEKPELVLTQAPGGASIEYGLKGDKPPFNDVRVREAFSKAINRQEIIDTLMDGAARIDTGLTLNAAEQALPADELKRLFAYDPDGARKLLQDAGNPTVDVEISVSDILNGLLVQTAELMQAQLKKVNINLRINPMPVTAFIEQVTGKGNYTAFLGSIGVRGQPSTELFSRHHSKGPQFSTGISDPELDAMIDRQATLARDPQGRAKLIQDIQRKIIALRGYNMLYSQDLLLMTWPYVKDYNPNGAISNAMADFAWVWFDK
jgi:peptide/nickel transport system substrate-binding protein